MQDQTINNTNKKQSAPDWLNAENSSIFNALAISSRLVSVSKFILSIFAFFLISLLVLWPIATSMDKKMKVNFANLQKGEAAAPTMENPKFHGIDRYNRPYTVFADSAIQEDTNTIRLKNINGEMSNNEGWMSLLSNNGTINIKKKELELVDSVSIFSDNGYEFVTSRAHVNLADLTAHGNQPVVMQGPMGILHANGFKADGKESRFIFTGPVDLTVYKKSMDNKKN